MVKRKKFFAYVVLIIGSLIIMFPFLWALLSSFKTNNEIVLKVPPTFFPEKFTIDGYITVLSEVRFYRWLLNSLFVGASITFLTLLTSSLGGYIYAKFNFKGKKLSFMVILATLMVPFEVIMIPSYLIISRIGLLNSLYGLIIPSAVSAFGIFLCKQFCESIPNDLIDAGRIDGATEFGIFFKLIVPEIKPTMSALAIFTFVGSWNNYLWPLIIINDENKMPITIAINFFNLQHFAQTNLVIVVCMLIIIPVIIVYFIFQKQFVEGLALTGMK